VSDRLDLLAAPGEAAAVADIVFGLLARRVDAWDSCDFRDLPAGSPLACTPLPLAARDRVEPETPCPALVLPHRPGDVVSALPKRRRDDLRRCARRLGEQGLVVCETADAESRPALLKALLDLHRRRWGAAAAPEAFHEEASAALLAAGQLRLHVLKLDGRVIAANYVLQGCGEAMSHIHAYDPAFAAFGPGWLLTAYALEQAVRDGARTFDFLRGREAYKYAWGATDRPQVRRRILR
jgi:CelD/BcsL family acetyltransferase involved in cellulose biosynthesis